MERNVDYVYLLCMKIIGALFFLCLLIFLSSCRKDEDFLKDPSAKLSFSTDSISYDTVFSSIGTSTKYFMVYNKNEETIEVSSIQLKGGTNSAFRINVDGIASTRIQNVKILPGDSLYVFVEATINPRDQDNPFFVEDAVEFVTNGNFQEVKLLAYGQDAYYIIADRKIGGLPPFRIAVAEGTDTTWTNKRPIVVYGFALVDSAATLRISEGTQIYFHQNSGLWIYSGATIKVTGSKANPVVFQGDRLEASYEDVPGQWDRIWINDGSSGNEFEYAVIKNAFIGLQAEVFPFADPQNPITAGLTLKNTIIQNSSAFGIYSAFFELNAENLLVSNSGQYNLAVLGGGKYTFKHSTFVNYFSSARRETPSVYVQNSIVNALGTKLVGSPELYFYNSIIDGANEEEFDFEEEVGGTVNYLFSNSLLKTKKDISSTVHFQNVLKNPAGKIFENVAEQDFHLAEDSPAIDFGEISVGNAVPLDLDGNSRVADGKPDAGAYEFQ